MALYHALYEVTFPDEDTKERFLNAVFHMVEVENTISPLKKLIGVHYPAGEFSVINTAYVLGVLLEKV